VTNEFPADLWIHAFRPPPAWSWFVEPGSPTDPQHLDLAGLAFPRAAQESFGFLTDLGFDLAPPDAWDLTDSAQSVIWERPDAMLVASLGADGSFWLMVAPRAGETGAAALRDRAMDLISSRAAIATFGSVPVLPRRSVDLPSTLAPYRDAIRDYGAHVLADRPIDFARLGEALDEALEAVRRPRLVAYNERRAEQAWSDGRYDAFLEATNVAVELGGRPADPARLALAEAQRAPSLTLGPDDLDEAERIRRGAALVEATRARVREAAALRSESAGGWAAWEDAARAFHQAGALLYSERFWGRIAAIRDGDAAAVDAAITFLEVDPWCFRSGYAKEIIVHRLKGATLTTGQAARLRRVVFRVIDVGDRREFRGYCHLARGLIDEGLRVDLLARLRSQDAGVARRALWVLDAVREPLGPEDRVTAQRILETAARDGAVWWRVARWVEPLTARYADPEWAHQLIHTAVIGGSGREAALRLLRALKVELSDTERSALAPVILGVIASGDDESYLERIAVLVDSPAFRARLREAYDGARDDETRRRAWWAMNAIRRFSPGGWPELERGE
jgi:hypothetical protein